MITHLYVMRHGIAVERGETDLADDDRPLLPKGERRTRETAIALRRLGLKLDRIIASPLARAAKTAAIAAEFLEAEAPLEHDDALRAERGAASIAAWLETRPESRVMIVGHNPALSELIGRLVGAPTTLCTLRKGGVAALRRRADRFEIDWIVRPRLIRRWIS